MLALNIGKGGLILDVATGTYDVAIAICKVIKNCKVIGIDPSMNMLKVGLPKIKNKNIIPIQGVGEELPFRSEVFDAVTIAFGIRNVRDRKRVLNEFYRVLKRDGRLLILEFSLPKGIFGKIYDLYFRKVLPTIGSIISKDNYAYRYLPESVHSFPDPENFMLEIKKAGFSNIRSIPLTFGICHLYIAEK